jgi:hypothetical protein
MDRATVMLVRAGDPHVAMPAVHPEAGMADGPVVRVEVVEVDKEGATEPVASRVAGEVVIVERQQRVKLMRALHAGPRLEVQMPLGMWAIAVTA